MIEQKTNGLLIEDKVGEIVSHQRERAKPGGHDLVPKPAEVIGYDDRFWPHLKPQMPWKNGLVTLSGEGFLATDHFLGRRTVFLEKPVTVDGIPYYLEVKGYGRNGKELWPQKHSERDLFFGMFMDSAKREFYIPQRLREQGISNIQVPVALLKFNEADFITYTRDELEKLITLRMGGGYPESERVISSVRKLVPQAAVYFDQDLESEVIREELAIRAADEIDKTYQTGGKKALRKLAEAVGLENELAGLIDPSQAGYVIRAVKSPIRVGDLHEPEIVTPQNKNIARQIGKTVRRMLELGFLDTSANPGNWTKAGELVDFEDVIRYPHDFALAKQDMADRNIPNTKSYLQFIFGEGTIGYLTTEFQTGFMDKQTTTAEVVKTSLEIMRTLS